MLKHQYQNIAKQGAKEASAAFKELKAAGEEQYENTIVDYVLQAQIKLAAAQKAIDMLLEAYRSDEG